MTKYTCINCPKDRRCVLESRGDNEGIPQPGWCPFGICDNELQDNSQWERTE